MRHHRTRRGVVLAAALAAAAVAAAEAQPANSFDELKELVELGEDVTITDSAGQVVTGRALDISPASLTLMADGVQLELDEGDVRRIHQSRHDPTRDGALIGLAAGAAPWLAMTAAAMRGDTDTRPGNVAGMMMITAASGLAGMLIGATVDAGRMEERDLYRTPGSVQPRGPFGTPREPRFEVAAGAHHVFENPPVGHDWLVSSSFKADPLDYVVEVAWFQGEDPGLPSSFYPSSRYLQVAAGVRGRLAPERRLTPFYQGLVGVLTYNPTRRPRALDVQSPWDAGGQQFLLQPGAGLDVAILRGLKLRLGADLLMLVHDGYLHNLPRVSLRAVVGF